MIGPQFFSIDTVLIYRTHSLRERVATCRVEQNKHLFVEADIFVTILCLREMSQRPLQYQFRPNTITYRAALIFNGFYIPSQLCRFVIIRTKLGVTMSAVEKMALLLEGSLNHHEAQILLRQNRDDPNSVEMVCGTPSKLEKEIKKHHDAEEDDITISKTLYLREGKVLSVRFRGNILCRSQDVDLRLAFNSHLLSRIRFDVQEIDKFAQKSIHCYRGFVQVFTSGFIPKLVPPADDNSRDKSRASVAIKTPQFIYISGDILLSELLVSLPKVRG